MRRLSTLSLWLVLTAAPVAAWAQAGTSTPAVAVAEPPKPVPPGFEKVAGAPDTQKVDASKLVVGAYAAFFIGMFGFLIMVSRRQADMAKELAELAARIDKKP